jgi:thymidylate kinase
MKRKKNTPELIKKRIEKRKQEDLLKQKKQEEEKQKIKERLEKILLKENIQILEPIDKVVQKYNFKCYCGTFFNRSLHNFIHQK